LWVAAYSLIESLLRWRWAYVAGAGTGRFLLTGVWLYLTITAVAYAQQAAQRTALIQATAARAYQSGVKMAFGTDMGVGPHGDNAREFVYLVETGVPAAVALQMATIRAAEVLGVDDQGVIAPGQRADIVAVKGNPLEDINRVLDVAFVMKDGVVYSQPGTSP
jgi:imidazolonepropionase-like amidohydrolase